MRLGGYLLDKDFPKQADYLFTASCQNNSYAVTPQLGGEKSSGLIGAKDSLTAVAFNRVCGDHGAYVKVINRGAR